ncbi:MAG: excinuclease ABC subunit UvrA, partial [Defluviitaleaceae bacterium]|nr:excinuclease ABC subunit UvrA [Defluviitaleaceae bacterium]
MTPKHITITGARTNNLKNINLQIPKGKITIFTGVSGSGKSSVVFDTIAQEAGRQLNETYSSFVRGFLPKYSQPDADAIENLSTAIVIDQKRLGGNARSTLGTVTDISPLLRLMFSRFGQPYVGYANAFSFNDPAGMCPECEGIGRIVALNLDAALDMDKSLNEGAILLPGFKVGNWQWKMYTQQGFFDNDMKLRDFPPEDFEKLVYAKAETVVSIISEDMNSTYEGLAERFKRHNIDNAREKSDSRMKMIKQFSREETCPPCGGKRFNAAALSSRINGYNIYDLVSMQLDSLVETLAGFPQNPITDNLIARVQRIIDIGLDYVTLERETGTLSGGESQRVKMVKYLSSSLTDLCYIFDEPSIGLHARDVYRLNDLLVQLRDKGNTVIVVEHDPDVIKIADYVIDMGPKAGSHGGEVVFSGSYDDLCKADTLTGRFMDQQMPINPSPKPSAEFYESTA